MASKADVPAFDDFARSKSKFKWSACAGILKVQTFSLNIDFCINTILQNLDLHEHLSQTV